MLKLEKINKSYNNQQILKDITINFRKNEFVSILGPSGSGKTTLLNIIGSLDKYDRGDLIINNKSTKSFTDKQTDAYRNSCIGFIFQNYNLISHLTIYENIEISLKLKGIKKEIRNKKINNILKEVGLFEYKNKYSNQLSGGQIQRVAIARALINNPKIILADEPTGALDSETSAQIMKLIKKISKDKLVIMVTHNKKIAKDYSDRIIELKDGQIIKDNKPYNNVINNEKILIEKTSMNFKTALIQSFKNIITKKKRTLLISIASSIGIIGLGIVLAISNGMNKELKTFEQNTLANLPIMIEKEVIDLSTTNETKKNFSDKEIINKSTNNTSIHYNNIDNKYIDYINKLDNNFYDGIIYQRNIKINTLLKDNNISLIDLNNYYKQLPIKENNMSYITNYYDLLKGNLPTKKEELLLVIDENNSINEELLNKLNLKENITFDDILNIKLSIATNNNYYEKINNHYKVKSNLEEIYNNSLKLKIVGIIRPKKDKLDIVEIKSGIIYTEELINYIFKENKNSNIVKYQKENNFNVLTGINFNNEIEKEIILSNLGENNNPLGIYIYPKNFKSKNKITKYLDNYKENKIIYIDQAEMFTTIIKNFINAITLILVAFSCISLIISSIMIGIITYISVLERKKEIGILRALGARKKDIKRIFTAETFIIGFTSGVIGILTILIIKIPLNKILFNITSLNNVVSLNIKHIILLIIISIFITIIGGLIPSTFASKQKPVDAIKQE